MFNKKVTSLFLTGILTASLYSPMCLALANTTKAKGIKTTVNIKANNKKITENQSISIAKKSIKKYFDYDISKAKFENDVQYYKYDDSDSFFVVRFTNKSNTFVAKVAEKDGEVFFVKQIKKDSKASKKPMSKNQALKIATNYLRKKEPAKFKTLKLTNQSFEYKYNSRDIKFYTFEYNEKTGKKINENRYVYVKVDTFNNYVTEVLIFWK